MVGSYVRRSTYLFQNESPPIHFPTFQTYQYARARSCSNFMPSIATEPFFTVSNPPGGGASSDPEAAQRSIDKLEEADGHENIFTIIAHDRTVLDVLAFFPHNLNYWQDKGYRKQVLWKFLGDFESALESPRTLPSSTP